jgi:hypothetical protein
MKIKLLFLLIVLSSCSLQKRLEKYCPLCVQETKTETVIEYRDTTIEIPGETVTVVDSLYCDSLGNVVSKFGDILKDKNGKILSLETRLRNNVYYSRAKVDTVYRTIKGNTIIKDKVVYKKGREIKVKYIPSWVIFFAYLGGISLIIILIYLTFKLIKKYLKP